MRRTILLAVAMTFSLVAPANHFFQASSEDSGEVESQSVSEEKPTPLITRDNRKLIPKGTNESRDLEAKLAVESWAREHNRDIKEDSLKELGTSNEERMQLMLDVLKDERHPLSLEAQYGMYSAAMFIRAVASRPGTDGAINVGKAKQLHLAREMQKAISKRLNLPDGYWDYKD